MVRPNLDPGFFPDCRIPTRPYIENLIRVRPYIENRIRFKKREKVFFQWLATKEKIPLFETVFFILFAIVYKAYFFLFFF